MSRSIRGFFLALCLALPAGRAADSPFKLAVIDAENSALAGLLEAELSHSGKLALVERKELPRLVEEKRLSALVAERKFAALGELLSAEGLLVMEKIPLPAGGEEITARLISVKNGACLFFVTVPRDVQPQEWAQGFSAQVIRAIPMAGIPRDKALPLCLVGLRAPVFTLDNAHAESALARLLEMRLAQLSNAVVLDRRRLADVRWERGLDASDIPPLWESAVLVDGEIESQRGSLAIELRLSRKNGAPLATATVRGPATDLDALATDAARTIGRELRASLPAGELSRESRVFFDEAVWAWRSGLYDRAGEALAAAAALGEKSPDALALRAWLLAERAAPEGIFFQGKTLKAAAPEPAEQAALLAEALDLVTEFRTGGGRLQHLSRDAGRDLLVPYLRRKVLERASVFLRGVARNSADADALRRKVQETALAPRGGFVDPVLAAQHVREWALTGEELVGFYESLLRGNTSLAGLLQHFPVSREEALGPRFLDASTKARWDAMWARVLQDEVLCHRARLLFAGRVRTPAEEASYREFLAGLAADATDLHQRGELKNLLWGDMCRRRFFAAFQAERTEAFVALSQALPEYDEGILRLADDLKIPPGRETHVWTALDAYRQKCLAAANDADLTVRIERDFAKYSGTLLKNNPGLRPARSSNDGLVVSRFWHPYGLPAWRDRAFGCYGGGLVAEGKSIWLIGIGRGGTDEVIEVELPELQARAHALPGVNVSAGALAVTAKELWVLHGDYPDGDRPMEMFLTRQDRETEAVKTFSLPRGESLELVAGRVFVSFGHPHGGDSGGLLEMDPRSGDVTTLISARRHPAQSPVDATSPMGVSGVALGPGGKMCVIISGQAAGIHELGGSWKKSDSVFWPDVLHFEKWTLLAGAKGDAILLDPSQTQPVRWLAAPENEEAFRNASRWLAPRSRMDMRFNAAAFRKDELFMVERIASGEHLLRWWFEGSPRTGLAIPLRFALTDETAAELERARQEQGPLGWGRQSGIELDALKNPRRMSSALQIVSSKEGIILHCGAHGFWFVPDSDLEAWRRENFPASKRP